MAAAPALRTLASAGLGTLAEGGLGHRRPRARGDVHDRRDHVVEQSGAPAPLHHRGHRRGRIATKAPRESTKGHDDSSTTKVTKITNKIFVIIVFFVVEI